MLTERWMIFHSIVFKWIRINERPSWQRMKDCFSFKFSDGSYWQRICHDFLCPSLCFFDGGSDLSLEKRVLQVTSARPVVFVTCCMTHLKNSVMVLNQNLSFHRTKHLKYLWHCCLGISTMYLKGNPVNSSSVLVLECIELEYLHNLFSFRSSGMGDGCLHNEPVYIQTISHNCHSIIVSVLFSVNIHEANWHCCFVDT